MATKHIFLPYVRQGAARLIEKVDFSSNLEAWAELKLQVTVGTGGAPATTGLIPLRLYGPGEVTGFDARQVIRTEPQPLANDFEPNYFPFIEFDRPDFPWLFTPAKATAAHKLRPWICLVVVTQKPEMTSDAPLPLLKQIDAAELPDLSESWLWAHAQVTIVDPAATPDRLRAQIKTVIQEKPAFNLSRLLCPRKLEEKTTYFACVVPTFKVGVQAGLGHGEIQASDGLEDAWGTGAIDLPVFYFWEFTTGAQGDFETLARKLQPPATELSSAVQGRPFSLVSPGGGLPSVPSKEGTLLLQGALAPDFDDPVSVSPPPDEDSAGALLKDFVSKLQDLLNAAKPETVGTSPLPPDLPVPPPIYGRWHAATESLDENQRQPPWLHDLNLNPVFRVAASLGTQVVQENQENLMAAAWDQFGAIEKANQLLRQAQLARDASNRVYDSLFTQNDRRLKILPTEKMTITAPMHAHVKMGQSNETVYGALKRNVTVQAAVTVAFRRLVRRRGPLSRRFGSIAERGFTDFAREMNLAGTQYTRLRNAEGKRGHSFEEIFDDLQIPNPDVDLQTWVSGLVERIEERIADDSHLEEVLPVWKTLVEQLAGMKAQPNYQPPIDFHAIGTSLIPALDPEQTIARNVLSRITNVPAGWQPDDVLEPIMVAPEFPTPMYKKLVELSQEYFLPGCNGIPQNTVMALSTNRRFIEAFMVGCNHEMGRELRWREFPTDQRGTYFRHFWDTLGRVPPPTADEAEQLKDIAPIHEWGRKSVLGANVVLPKTIDPVAELPPTDRAVLLVRGELLYRYPRTIIYMVKGKKVGDDIKPLIDPSSEVYPSFHGSLSPDILFFGFDVDPDDASSEPGYFFVFQQPPTELRFGLDEAPPPLPLRETPIGWDDLTWADVTKTSNGYWSVARGPSAEFSGIALPGTAADTWSAAAPSVPGTPPALPLHAAQFAVMTQQDPFRVAIHASDLLVQAA